MSSAVHLSVLLPVIMGVLCILLAIGCYVLWQRAENASEVLQQREIEIATLKVASDNLATMEQELIQMRLHDENEMLARVKAQTRLEELQAAQLGKEKELAQMRHEFENMRAAHQLSQTQGKVLEQKMASLEEQRKAAEQVLQEMKDSARASVIQAGAELSSKLLDDHKREREEGRLELEKTLTGVNAQIQLLQGKAASVETMQMKLDTELNTLTRTLSNPSGAGAHTEVSFENLLKNLGLKAKQDFFLQHHFVTDEGRAFRPDCIILLPQDTVLVVDCKSSPYVMEYARADEKELRQEVLQKLVASMHAHIRQLATKEYGAHVQKDLKKQTGRIDNRIINVMYCPSEVVLERVLLSDPTLRDKALAAGIALVGSASLPSLFNLAKLQIVQAQQAENQQQIILLLSQWMSDITGALKHAEKIGNAVKSAMGAYDSFAGSVNRNVLSRMQKIVSHGVEPSKAGALPQRLARYDINNVDDVITGESEEVGESVLLEMRKEA